MSEANASAFPWVSHGGVHEHQVVQGGLTKREYIAAMAMQAEVSHRPACSEAETPRQLAAFAKRAVMAADALLAELAKEPQS